MHHLIWSLFPFSFQNWWISSFCLSTVLRFLPHFGRRRIPFDLIDENRWRCCRTEPWYPGQRAGDEKSTVRAIPETRAPFEENTWGMQAMPVATEAESANQSVTICGCGSDAIDFMFAAIPSLPRAKEPQVWCSMLWRLQQSQPWGRSIELLENMENHAAWRRCCGNSVCEFWLLNPLVFVSFQAHICLQVCGRPLSCGNHTCEDRTVSSFFHSYSYKLCRDCGSSCYHWF